MNLCSGCNMRTANAQDDDDDDDDVVFARNAIDVTSCLLYTAVLLGITLYCLVKLYMCLVLCIAVVFYLLCTL